MSNIRTLTAADMTIGARYRGTAQGPTELVGRDFTVEAIAETTLATAAEIGDPDAVDLVGFSTTLLVHGKGGAGDDHDAAHDERREVAFAPGDMMTQRQTFEAGYVQTETRVQRKRLCAEPLTGVATVMVRGTVLNATEAWVDRDRRGNLCLFAEVETNETHVTEIKVAVVPTGKRVPALDPTVKDLATALPTVRLGSSYGQHVYLLSVDGSLDRAAYDAAQTARRALRRAQGASTAALDAEDDLDG